MACPVCGFNHESNSCDPDTLDRIDRQHRRAALLDDPDDFDEDDPGEGERLDDGFTMLRLSGDNFDD